MARVAVASMFWRLINKANYDNLTGWSDGQYHVTLTSSKEVPEFFSGLTPVNHTSIGGYDLMVPFEPLDGPNAVPAQEVRLKFMGPRSARKDWEFPAQRPKTAYPLWRFERIYGSEKPPPDLIQDRAYLVVLRDEHGRYHGRWFTAEDVESLPEPIRRQMRSRAVGILSFDAPAAGASAIASALRTSLNVLLYGPPGTGKTHLVNEVIGALQRPVLSTEDERTPLRFAADDLRVAFVTFHQSYTYEEFMIALMPSEGAGTGLLTLRPKPGLLLELAEFASQPGKEALLVIDEINRGNVSRIFGEFITVMEADKRRAGDGSRMPTTVEVRLPYLAQPVMFPRRLYVLATMNSIDRSVAPLDAALRRRFRIVELSADVEVLREPFGLDDTWSTRPIDPAFSSVEDYRVLAMRVLQAVNDRVAFFRGPEFALGPWYFADLVEADGVDAARDALIEVWQSRVLPQIEELFAGRPEQLRRVLRLENAKPGEALSLSVPDPQDTEIGARPFLRKRDDGAAVLEYLLRLTGPKRAAAE